MNIITRIFMSALLASVLTNCVTVLFVETYNNTGKPMSFPSRQGNGLVQTGQAARLPMPLDQLLHIKIDGNTSTYRVFPPQPHNTYLIRSLQTTVVRLQLNADGKLYAVSVREKYPIGYSAQPKYFPLSNHQQD